MKFLRVIMFIALALAVSILAMACGQPAAAPTATAPAKATNTPGKAPVASPTTAASPTAAAKATTAPAKAAGATPAAGGPSPSELANRARTAGEYSFDVSIAAAGQTMTGKGYIKGSKMRQEISMQGMNTVMLMDSESKVAYMFLPAQNSAMKLDFSAAQGQAPSPSEQVGTLPSDARFVGNETVDGKPASVYETTSGDPKTKIWIWTERGLPLKVEATSAQGVTTVEFTNYQFGPQPDESFELPPGTQIIEAPVGIPGVPGGLPVPKK